MQQSLTNRLAQGDERTLGETNAIVREALDEPALIEELVACLKSHSSLVESRAANALKKIVTARPAALHPFAKPILHAALGPNHPAIAQWNLTLLLGKLRLKGRDRAAAIELLFERLKDKSSLQRTFSMQALADLAMEDVSLRKRIAPLLEELHSERDGCYAGARKEAPQAIGNSKMRFAPTRESVRMEWHLRP